MRGLVTAILVLAIAVFLGACSGSSIPSSSLTIRDATTNALLAASNAQGTLTLNVGDTRQIKVEHTYTNDARNTETNEVTQFVIWKWDMGSGATVDALGNISGIAPGTSVLRAKYDPEWLGSSDNVRLTIIVN